MQELVVQQRQLLRSKRTKRLSLSQSKSKCVALLGSGHWLSSQPQSRWGSSPPRVYHGARLLCLSTPNCHPSESRVTFT